MSFKDFVVCSASAAAICASVAPVSAIAQEASHNINVPAQSLGSALRSLGSQARVQIAFNEDLVARLRGREVQGELSARQALDLLLAGSGLTARETDSGVFVVSLSEELSAWGADATELPEIVVAGTSSLNADLRHSEDEVRPYYVFTAEDLRNSQASDVGQFLRDRVSMNAQVTQEFSNASGSNVSSVSLRGLGSNNTLILVDGRPVPSSSIVTGFYAQDFNGIPISSIERIEVLPSSSGGLYGGNAIGGVINIILKRDYNRLNLDVAYTNTLDTDSGVLRTGLSGGRAFFGGRTRAGFSVSQTTSNLITREDRPYDVLVREMQFRNNPAGNFALTTPPISTTPNIRSSTGANLVLDDGRALNSPYTFVPPGYAAGGNLQGFIDNAGRYNLAQAPDLNGAQRSLRADPKIFAASINLRQDVNSWLELYLDGRFESNEGSSQNPTVPSGVTIAANAPHNPFRQSIRVSFPSEGVVSRSRYKQETTNILFGGIVTLPFDWRGSFDLSRASASIDSASATLVFDPIGTTAIRTGLAAPDGRPAINVVQDPSLLDFTPYLLPADNITNASETVYDTATVRVGGALPGFLGVEPVLAMGFDYRDARLGRLVAAALDTSVTPYGVSYSVLPPRSSTSKSVFANIVLPLIEDGENARWGSRAEITGTVRYDEFDIRTTNTFSTTPTPDATLPNVDYTKTNFSSENYTLGGLYAPTRDIALRASYATGFSPPFLYDLTPVRRTWLAGQAPSAADPLRGGEPVGLDVDWVEVTGGNPNLQPETSTTRSLGFIFTPRFVPGLRIGVDYTEVQREGEVVGLFPEEIIAYDFAGRVERENRPLTAQEIALGYTGTPIIFLDVSPVNTVRSRATSVDYKIDYEWSHDLVGDFHLSVLATNQRELSRAVLPDSQDADTVGYAGYPLSWKANAQLSWARGPFSAGWSTQYAGRYRIWQPTDDAATIATRIANQGSEWIPSQMRHDLYFAVDLDVAAPGSMFAGTRLNVGVKNVFDTEPLLNAGLGIPAHYSDTLGRRYTLQLTKRF